MNEWLLDTFASAGAREVLVTLAIVSLTVFAFGVAFLVAALNRR